MATFIFDHMLDKTLDMSEWTMDIDILQCEMVIKIVLLEQTSHWDTSILNNDVQFLPIALQLSNNFVSNFFNIFKICHVKLNNLYTIRDRTGLLNTLKLFYIPSTDDCMGLKFVELVDEVFTDTRWCTCYPDCLIFESRSYEVSSG